VGRLFGEGNSLPWFGVLLPEKRIIIGKEEVGSQSRDRNKGVSLRKDTKEGGKGTMRNPRYPLFACRGGSGRKSQDHRGPWLLEVTGGKGGTSWRGGRKDWARRSEERELGTNVVSACLKVTPGKSDVSQTLAFFVALKGGEKRDRIRSERNGLQKGGE